MALAEEGGFGSCMRISFVKGSVSSAGKEVSARDMSLSLGQNVNYINTIENHNSLPSMTAFFYICDYLHVTPSQFFDDSISYPVQIQEILEGLKYLTKEELDAVQSVVRVLSKNPVESKVVLMPSATGKVPICLPPRSGSRAVQSAFR